MSAPKPRRRRLGFSLMELLVALSLSGIVLTGVVMVSASLMRSQFDTNKRGEVSGLTLVAIAEMNRRIAQGTHLRPNMPNTTGGNTLEFCTNWTAVGGGERLNPNDTTVEWWHYCVEPVSNCPPGYTGAACYTLWRYNGVSTGAGATCAPPAIACGTHTGDNRTVIVANNLYYYDGSPPPPVFRRDDSIGGVELRYIVGIATPSENRPIPIAYKVLTRIAMNKSYASTAD